MTDERAARSGRFAALDRRPVNQDGLAHEDPGLGLVALRSPDDPDPSLVIGADGRVAEMDGTPRERFDMLDRMIADHGLDLAVAPEAMALADGELARRIVDPGYPREEVARLVGGITPAKLAAVVRLLRPVEMQMAIGKMRVRRTPSIQAHVTNRLDDPLLIAADAATAVAFGFRELETTVPVLEDAPSNAVALLIGSQVAAPGALTQCSVEEAMELELGMRGLTTYAETVSLYGTEQVFVDGDDTPWSKAFLCSAYASRGLKMRVTSGGGAEVLMGAAEGRSMLYLESRCVALARAIGAQGVQNGGIDGASVVGAVPDGMRELLAENLMVMLRDLESCSGNDTQVSESDIRRTAHTVPLLLAGSDFLFSGFGSVTRYDNMFGPSNFNGDDLDDYLVLQRDWGVDGGLRPAAEADVLAVRERAARAVRAVYRRLGLADYDEAHVQAVVEAHGSKEVPLEDPLAVLRAASAVQRSGVTALEVVAALAEEGFAEEAERVLAMIRERLKGDYLQTAAIFDEEMRVLSKVTDPNDYAGPGTGYEPDRRRRREIASVRQELSVREVRAEQELAAATLTLVEGPPAEVGSDPREVAIGLSPAAGRGIWTTLSGISVRDALREIEAGLEEEGCEARLIRVRSTVDLGLVGLTAARLAGSGIAIGLQGKGTALIHRRDLVPLANLELYSVAPLIDREMYRTLGINAGRHAKGVVTVPAKNPYTEEAITARYHTRALALVAIERERSEPAVPIELTRAVR
ncbi:MAG: propanediol/glycerol family dehydratase large subunit [Actinobacteria bacterium]|nr:propanediol/glycerol family dehydratase large subunit [Actinomycetota bacterium]